MQAQSISARMRLAFTWAGLRKPALVAALFLLLVAALTLSYQFIPMHSHWATIYRPVTLEFLAGRTPYSNSSFFNPVWALLPLIPAALLPEALGHALIGAVSLVSFALVAYRVSGKAWLAAAFLLAPPVFYHAYQINLDFLVALGFLMPPQIGLFFIVIKPQIGVGVGVFWLVETWRAGRARRAARLPP